MISRHAKCKNNARTYLRSTACPCTSASAPRADSLYLAGACAHRIQNLNPPRARAQVDRLPVFFRQRAARFYPAASFTGPPLVLHLPFSLVEVLAWAAAVYYTVGLAPGVDRCVCMCSWFYVGVCAHVEVLAWAAAVYYTVGLAPGVDRCACMSSWFCIGVCAYVEVLACAAAVCCTLGSRRASTGVCMF